jgi:hypothetical protein
VHEVTLDYFSLDYFSLDYFRLLTFTSFLRALIEEVKVKAGVVYSSVPNL